MNNGFTLFDKCQMRKERPAYVLSQGLRWGRSDGHMLLRTTKAREEEAAGSSVVA
jgi:hypothetical protein